MKPLRFGGRRGKRRYAVFVIASALAGVTGCNDLPFLTSQRRTFESLVGCEVASCHRIRMHVERTTESTFVEVWTRLDGVDAVAAESMAKRLLLRPSGGVVFGVLPDPPRMCEWWDWTVEKARQGNNWHLAGGNLRPVILCATWVDGTMWIFKAGLPGPSDPSAPPSLD